MEIKREMLNIRVDIMNLSRLHDERWERESGMNTRIREEKSDSAESCCHSSDSTESEKLFVVVV